MTRLWFKKAWVELRLAIVNARLAYLRRRMQRSLERMQEAAESSAAAIEATVGCRCETCRAGNPPGTLAHLTLANRVLGIALDGKPPEGRQ